jgi:hypothetical protein
MSYVACCSSRLGALLYTSRVLGLRPSALFIEFEITYKKKMSYMIKCKKPLKFCCCSPGLA